MEESSPHTGLTADTSAPTLSIGRRRIACYLLLPTVAVLALTAGLGLALTFYLLDKKIPGQTLHQVVFVNGSLYADEGLKNLPDGRQEAVVRGLLISQITSSLISWSVPMVMGMVAFRLAATWASHGDAKVESNVLPTPEQYGHLLNMCSSASLYSLYKSARYLSTSRSDKPAVSSLMTRAFVLLAVVSIFSVAISLADTWLHAEASAVLYSPIALITGDALSAPTVAFGTGFNTTLCSKFGAASNDEFCGQNSGDVWAGGSPFVPLRGYSVAGNRSADHLVTTLNDENWMAIVTRPNVANNVTYTARSLGLTASCVGLAHACLQNNTNNLIPVNCSNLSPEAAAFPGNHNSFMLWKSGLSLAQGMPLQPQQTNSNLFNALVELYYPSPNTDTGSGDPPNDAIITDLGFAGGASFLLLANCSFAAYDIVIEVTSGQTTLVTQSNASDETTGRLWPGLLYGSIMSPLIVNTQSVAVTSTSGQEVMADISQEIARLTLASAAGIFAPIAPDTAGVVHSRLVSAYPFPPLALFLGLLFIYAAISIALFVWCVFALSPTFQVHVAGEKTRTVALVMIVQMLLTSPMAFVAFVFAPAPPTLLDVPQDALGSTGVVLPLQTDKKAETTTTGRVYIGFTAWEEGVPQFEMRQRRKVEDES